MKIILRAEAKASGYQKYFTGVPCWRNHIAERYTSNSKCVECSKVHIQEQHPLLSTYKGMIQRCYNLKRPNYKDYGNKGIEVCDRWLDQDNGFNNFVSDMGDRPDGCTLDRIDYNGNYEPSNCRWADKETQERNKHSTKIKGEDLPKIVEMRKSGLTLHQIAAYFCSSAPNISQILSGKSAGGRFKVTDIDCRKKEAA